MIKVAFISNVTKEWMGEIHYLSNLFYAVSLLEDRKIKPVIFLGKNVDKDIIKKFEPYTQIVYDSLFDRKSIKWFISTFLEYFFNITFLKARLLKKHDINAISHSGIITGFNAFKIINWIPDFQHYRRPDFFSDKEIRLRNTFFHKIIAKSDTIIVSSKDAYNDAKMFAPEAIAKIKILNFVSQPNTIATNLDNSDLVVLENKYDFQGKYFYLPNQFWKHKNHMQIFNAIKKLKEQGVEVTILCSGYMKDYRNPFYIDSIKAYITENNLESNIKLLGLIDYNDVLCLMRYSLAVINPSLFEGWSSTVEECKSLGKNMILSDIPIHREQNPDASIYFTPGSVENAVAAIKSVWLDGRLICPNIKLEKQARNKLKKRTITFAEMYQNIALEQILE